MSSDTTSPRGGVQALLTAAAQATQAGDAQTAAARLAEAVDLGLASGAALPRNTAFELARLLHGLGRYAEAEARARQGLERQPNDSALNNLLGVALKNQGRFAEALEALARAQKADPKGLSPLVNRGNVYLAMGDGPRALDSFRRLVRVAPKDPEHQRLLGLALEMAGDSERALQALELARRLNPRSPKAWLDAGRILRDLGRLDEALALVERGLAAAGPVRELVCAKAHLLRAAGRHPQARAYLTERLSAGPDAAWLHDQLGLTAAPFDRPQANLHWREAVRLAPGHLGYRVALAESLDRTRGPGEADNVQAAYDLARGCAAEGGDLKAQARVLCGILERCGDYAAADRVGDFASLGHYWATHNEPAALHHQLARVETAEDRRLLVDFHRTWGRTVDALAQRSPLRRPPRDRSRGRIRVGFMSSDLRDHPVSYFVLPLLEGYDRGRFEVYCYSWARNHGLAPGPGPGELAGLSPLLRPGLGRLHPGGPLPQAAGPGAAHRSQARSIWPAASPPPWPRSPGTSAGSPAGRTCCASAPCLPVSVTPRPCWPTWADCAWRSAFPRDCP